MCKSFATTSHVSSTCWTPGPDLEIRVAVYTCIVFLPAKPLPEQKTFINPHVAPNLVAGLFLPFLTVRMLRYYSAVSMLYLYRQTNIEQTALDQDDPNVIDPNYSFTVYWTVSQHWDNLVFKLYYKVKVTLQFLKKLTRFPMLKQGWHSAAHTLYNNFIILSQKIKRYIMLSL